MLSFCGCVPRSRMFPSRVTAAVGVWQRVWRCGGSHRNLVLGRSYGRTDAGRRRLQAGRDRTGRWRGLVTAGNGAVSNESLTGGGEEEEEGVPVEVFTVDEAESAERLDKVLANRFPGQSRNYFHSLIAADCVKVNGLPLTKKSAKLKPGSLVELAFKEPEDRSTITPADVPLDVLYEDEHILAINKDAGMVVHPAPGNWDGTLVNALAFRYGDAFVKHEGTERHGIVHRLDKGTSGVMVVARSPSAHRHLQDQFRARSVKKTYLAISSRNPLNRGTISRRLVLPIGRHPQQRTKMDIVEESKGGRTASTIFYHVASDADNLTTLLRVVLETGRTHQIRVHLKELRAPILGDDVYGYSLFNEKFKMEATRPLLHAFQLQLTHPVTGQRMLFEAPLPEDMLDLIERDICDDFLSQQDQLIFKADLY